MTQELQAMSQPGYGPSPAPVMQAPVAQPPGMQQQSPQGYPPQGLTTAIPSPSTPQSPHQMVAQWQQGQPQTQMPPQQFYQPAPTGQPAWGQVAMPQYQAQPVSAYTSPPQQTSYQQLGIPAVTGPNQPGGVEELRAEYRDYGQYALEAAAYDSNARALRTLTANQRLTGLVQATAGPVVAYWQQHGVDPASIKPENLEQAVGQLVDRTTKMEALLSNPEQLSSYFLALDADHQQRDPNYGQYAGQWEQTRQMVEYLMQQPAMLQAVMQMIQGQQGQGQQQQQAPAVRQGFPAPTSASIGQQGGDFLGALQNVHPAKQWQAIRSMDISQLLG